MSPESPLLQNKHYQSAAIFNPANLLRETRRQKALPPGEVPHICVLDPDGDIVAYLLREKLAERNPYWACYHTALYQFEVQGIIYGIIGCAVGGPFAVLLAEQLFESGCRLLVSITSAGQILPVADSICAEFGNEFRLLEQVDETHLTPWHTEQRFSYFRFRRDAEAVVSAANVKGMYPRPAFVS